MLKKLEAYDFAFLIPGHGEVQTDRAYLQKLEWALGVIRARVGPLARQGLALADVRRQASLDTVKTAFAGDDGWQRFLMDAVFLGDIVKNAYQEAKGDSIVQGGGS